MLFKRFYDVDPAFLRRINYFFFLAVLAIALPVGLNAQNYPLYNGYFLNPFIYNPAAAGSPQLELNASYRKQWIGIEGAPSVSAITGNMLLDGTRAGVGLKISSFSRGFLTSTDFSASYAYGVPLSKTNRLWFGLSGGMLSNMFDLSDASSLADPALAQLSNSMTPTLSFGMLFKSASGLNLGLILPSMIQRESYFNDSGANFDNLVATISFSKWNPVQAGKKVTSKSRSRSRGKKATNVPLELFGIYRYSTFGGLMEVTGKYNFSEALWASLSYRQNQGLIPGLGINLKNVSINYFYEPGFGGDLPMQSHEVLLNVRLGKVHKYREAVAPTPQQTTKVVPKKPEPVKVEPPKPEPPPVVVIPPTPQVDTAALRIAHEQERRELDKHIDDHDQGAHDDAHSHPVNERHEFVKRGGHHEELEATNYVIAGAFKSRTNAEHYTNTLKGMGYADADFGHVTVKNLWYVIIADDPDVEAARAERNRLQKLLIFKDVWLLTVQE